MVPIVVSVDKGLLTAVAAAWLISEAIVVSWVAWLGVEAMQTLMLLPLQHGL